MRGVARRWPVRAECLLTVHILFKSLEDDYGMDRVPRCHLLTPFQEGIHHKLVAQEKNQNCASKVANWLIADILKYLY